MFGRNKILVWRRRYYAALIVLILAVAAAGGLVGWWLKGAILEDTIAAMQARIDSLETRNLELSQLIDEEAVAALRSQVRDLHGQVMNQRTTIYGLQQMITPEEARAGLRIHSVSVEPGRESQDYRLSVGLTQALLARSDRARGHVEVRLAGTLDGDGAEFSLQEIGQPQTSRLEFNFESSTALQANMTLPTRFQPRTIKVRVTPDPDEEHRFEREFPWAPLTPST